MALQIFGLRDHPDAFPVSKTMDKWEDCVFLLDFSRPIRKYRHFFGKKVPFGICTYILVPIVHAGEENGGFVFGVGINQPYFRDLPKLWRKHRGKPRTVRIEKADGLRIIADFANNFPEEAKSSNET